jgi:mannosyltransferase
VPWCWLALATVILGYYQVGRPVLWRDELASWSFASRPVSSLIAIARNTGATQMAYYLLKHFWMAAVGDSAVPDLPATPCSWLTGPVRKETA